MKYSKFLLMCLCASFLCGCDAELYKKIETVPVETTDSIIVNTVISEETTVKNDKAEISDKTSEEAAFLISTEESSFELDPVEEGYQLSSADENYKYEKAYRSGDYSELKPEEIELLNIALTLLEPVQNMSEFVVATKIHDSLTALVHYGLNDNQYSAYGALVGQEAVCQGYSYAFKLCMDLAGIDCITVGGKAVNSEGEQDHCWNMVKLGNFWYHVDVTWDDPILAEDKGAWCHMYLFTDDDFIYQNHTSNTIVQGLHGINAIPVAEDRGDSYLKLVGACATNQQEFENIFSGLVEKGSVDFEILCDEFTPSIDFVKNICSSCNYIEQKVGNSVYYYFMIQ